MTIENWDVEVTGVDAQHAPYSTPPVGTPVFPAAMYFAAAHPGIYCVAPRTKFQRLTQEWRADTGQLSLEWQIAAHPSYQMIIGMGPMVLPFILEDLRHHGGQWYWALRAITEQSPVPSDAAGNIQRMKDAWVHWGAEQGYVLPA
jgi:hypothetical protein